MDKEFKGMIAVAIAAVVIGLIAHFVFGLPK